MEILALPCAAPDLDASRAEEPVHVFESRLPLVCLPHEADQELTDQLVHGGIPVDRRFAGRTQEVRI
jgi:hypothetical protein